MAYAVFESTNMASTKYAERIFDAVAETDIENGTFGYLGKQNKDYVGHVVYNFEVGTTDGLKAGEIVVADNPAWEEDESKITNQRRDAYVIPAGTVFRVRVVRMNDEFAVSELGFTAATKSVATEETDFIENDVYVTIDAATGKLVATTSKPASGALIGRIMRKRTVGATIVTPARTYGSATAMYEIKVIGVAIAE